MTDTVIHAIVLILYLFVMLGIGIYFYRKNKNQTDYFLGGRNLNVWVTSIERAGFGYERLASHGPSRHRFSSDEKK